MSNLKLHVTFLSIDYHFSITLTPSNDLTCLHLLNHIESVYRDRFPKTECPAVTHLWKLSKQNLRQRLARSDQICTVLENQDTILVGKKSKMSEQEQLVKVGSVPTYAFTIVFHTLSYGFHLSNDGKHCITKIKTISSASCYTRLTTGAVCIQIGNQNIESCSDVQVNHLLKNAQVPIALTFRGFFPSPRRSSMSSVLSTPSPFIPEIEKKVVEKEDGRPEIDDQENPEIEENNNEEDIHHQNSTPVLPTNNSRSLLHDVNVQEMMALQKALWVKKTEMENLISRMKICQRKCTSSSSQVPILPLNHTLSFQISEELLSVLNHPSYSTQVVQKNGCQSPTHSEVSNLSRYSIRSTQSAFVKTLKKSSHRTPSSSRKTSTQPKSSRYSYLPASNGYPGVGDYNVDYASRCKGGTMPKGVTPRNSYIPKTDGPGVGRYQVDAVHHRVKGGEIGDAMRELRWV